MDGYGTYHVNQDRARSERQIPHILSHMWITALKYMAIYLYTWIYAWV